MKTDTPSHKRPPSIMVVDDLPSNLELLTRMLHKRGYEPRPFPNGRLALAAARVEPPDLVLLDVNLPGMNGFEICRQLKEDPVLKDIPVIFITVHAGTEEKLKAFAAGAVDYVTKPFHGEEINARMAAHLKIRSLQRQLAGENERLEHLVAERTRQLAAAYARQVELGRLKADFLRMISHEIRTPVHGVLGIGGLLLDLLPHTEQAALYQEGFKTSAARLHDLIEDATTLTALEGLSPASGQCLGVVELVERTRSALPKLKIEFERPPEVDAAQVYGAPELLEKALKTMIELTAAFSKQKKLLRLRAREEGQTIRFTLAVDALRLSAEAVADFFKIESSVRSASAAEELGLGPVVAQQIIAAFGGEATLSKGGETSGELVIALRKVQPTTGSA